MLSVWRPRLFKFPSQPPRVCRTVSGQTMSVVTILVIIIIIIIIINNNNIIMIIINDNN